MSTRLETGSAQTLVSLSPATACEPVIHALTETHQGEVLEFLCARPMHTVYMASLIRDHGLVSSLNRGFFFGCRNETEALEGVALLGHATMMETESEQCIRAFAKLAKNHYPAHLIRGEQQKIQSFWSSYAEGIRTPRLLCVELLLKLRAVPPSLEAVAGLRQATLADLETIVNVNASMAFTEGGVNPLTTDPEGFRERTARRIGKGRVWVWIENGRLLYKTDVVADTPQAIYLEGVYVHPDNRMKGYGLRCLSQLGGALLERTKTVCLAVNEKAIGTRDFYRRAGYEEASRYDAIYLDN